MRLGFFLVVVFATPVFAQNDNAASVDNQPEEVVVVPSTDSVSLSEDGKVSLDFRDAEIRTVLQVLALKSNVNIVAGPEVAGTVSIQLNDVPWKQALDVILQTYNYVHEQRGNVIIVTTVQNLRQRREDSILLQDQEPMVTKTFPLNFGKASEVVASAEKIISERGKVDFDERTNTIIVTDTVSQVDLMEQVIRQLDTTTPQVLIEAKIIETTFTNTENLGIDWTTALTVAGAQRPTTFPFTNSSENKYARDNFVTPDTTAGSANTEFTFGTLNFTQLKAVFELLRTRSTTNILSAPRIVTVDNKAASIVVGSQYPIPSYVYNEDQARLQINGFEYKDIGIIFEVTPHVNSSEYVTLDIEPRITGILEFVTVENTSLPRLSNQTAKTSIVIKDGNTLVIGGLIKDQTTDTKKKTPFLGDVPILGLIFQKKNEQITKTDLMIFVTPHIITPVVASGS